MLRTLVISDLHIGTAGSASSVMARPAALERLLDALERYDRLVLLGDLLELHRPAVARRALEAAAPVLRAIGAKLGAEREVVIVAGNHDRELVDSWIRARDGELGVAMDVPNDATEALGRVISLLAPARARAAYPGVWLSDRVWATHGHYIDPHLLPVGAYGLARLDVRRRRFAAASVRDYERATGPQAGRAGHALRKPVLALIRPAIAPYAARVLDHQMRGQALPAMAHVARRLGVSADWVLFGHVHRLGPLAVDDPARWCVPAGGQRLANTGAWVYEPLLMAGGTPREPYWPGGALTLEGDEDPRAISLLADLPPSALRP